MIWFGYPIWFVSDTGTDMKRINVMGFYQLGALLKDFRWLDREPRLPTVQVLQRIGTAIEALDTYALSADSIVPLAHTRQSAESLLGGLRAFQEVLKQEVLRPTLLAAR